jgi:folate-binding protein YgfZ
MDDNRVTQHDGYQAAISGAAIYRTPEPGFLHIAGADRLDFIQRQTTQDVRRLRADRTVLTVLTTGTARIIDVWRLVAEPDSEQVGVITLPGQASSTTSYLRTRIFFMDKVTVTDANAEFAQIELFGPTAANVLQASGAAQVPSHEQVITAAIGGIAARVIGLEGLIGRGYGLIMAAEQAEPVIEALARAGATALDDATHDVLRVEAGLPEPGHELTGDYTPLEANLDKAISSSKGCYSGQEIIARQITYDKVTKRLVGIMLEAGVAPGAAVQVDGRTVGTITSVAESPRFGSIALAVLKRPHFEAGTAVSVTGADEQLIQGDTVSLPFAN